MNGQDLFLIAAVVRWAWPGCVASWRCKAQNSCLDCSLLVPCNKALCKLIFPLPAVRVIRG